MLRIHQNVINIVQSKFPSSELVKCIHLNVSLSKNDWTGHKILALVCSNTTYALFILISEQKHPTTFSDLTIEKAIPIDQYFSCDTDFVPGSQNSIIFNVNYKRIKLQFVIEIGEESSNFASEVIRATEIFNNQAADFNWLEKYTIIKDLDMDGELLDIGISRQKLALGENISTKRESILRYHMDLKKADYTNNEEFLIYVGTWNVNGQLPPDSLKNWLSCDDEPPDLYAIGFQEIDLSKEAFLFNEIPRADDWHKAVIKGLNSKAMYKTIMTRLVGMMLVVLIQNKHYQYIKNVAVDTVGTGILGKIGNKGGVAIRFELHNTLLCFVNCHLAAHVDEVERRNQDYNDINARINFKTQPQLIGEHDQIYWLGDLNYRVTNMPTHQVKELINRNDLRNLLLHDQLNKQIELKKVLQGYQEGDITFKPTYKYNLESDVYDTSEKARAPAWTDRIFWRGKGIYQIAYRSHMDIKSSDHKPVSALFKSEISVIDQAKHKNVHEEVLKKLDRWENEFLPQVTIDTTEVVFDLVKFKEPQSKFIIIANTGQVPADFEFIKKLNDSNYCKDWLRITPYSGSIKPGEKCDICLEVNLESSLDKLDDILVLHLIGGKDMFIIISGNCQRSCFMESISTLCRAPVPILHMASEQMKHAESQQSPVLYSIPRELWLLVDHLYRHGLKTKELFESTSLHDEIIQIRDWLDRGSLDPMPGSIYAVADSLLLFLSYTRDPIIPAHLHDRCIAAASNFLNCKEIILQRLPDLERNVFLYLCMFLQELLKYSSDNGTDAKTLATLFGELLLRDPIRNARPQASRGKANFIYHFLVNDQSTLIIPNNETDRRVLFVVDKNQLDNMQHI